MDNNENKKPKDKKGEPQKKSMLPLVLLVLALGAVAYFTKEKWSHLVPMLGDNSNGAGSGGSGTGGSSSTGSSSSNSSAVSNVVDNTKVLSVGSKGASVKELQRLLNKEHDYQVSDGVQPLLPKLVEDGIFGPKTLAKLQAFAGQASISINSLKQLLENQKK